MRLIAVRLSDLRAVFINCTLKRSPEVSNTEGLADLSMTIMRRTGDLREGDRRDSAEQRPARDAGTRFDLANPEHRA